MPEQTTLNTNLVLGDKFVLYSGMRNPSNPDEVSWMAHDTYTTKAKAVTVMRNQHAQHGGGLWMIVRETPVAGFLPARKTEENL